MRFATQVIHVGVDPDPRTGAVMTPIYQTSTYAQTSPGVHTGYEYSRTDNPTRTVLQTQLAALEGGDDALVFGSGLAAIDAVFNLLRVGDHVVAGDDLYGGTNRLLRHAAAARGIVFDLVDASSPEAVGAALRPETRLVWLETPTNPLLRIVDVAAVSAVVRAGAPEALVVVDNTFATPVFQRPLALGADVVMHSATKYLNGHSDVVMGALVFRDVSRGWLEGGLRARLRYLQNALGGVPGPMDCFLVLRGLKTLDVRMRRHAANGEEIARRLKAHPAIERLLYPGDPDHPGHAVHLRQAGHGGGMISAEIRGGLEPARRFLERLELFTLAESLGGVESLVEHPAIMTHASVPAELRARIGLGDGLVRLSVGIEDVEDLWADLERALGNG